MPTDFDPVQLLQEDLKEDDTELVVQSLGRLNIVAMALGPQRTRDELLPYLSEYKTDKDEVNAVLAKQLGSLVDLVGGQEHVAAFLPILEKHAALEETLIREAAVSSFNQVIPRLSSKDILVQVFPMIKRMATHEFFPSQVSACGIVAVTYPLVPEELQAELRTIFKALCADETPLVRKAAFIGLVDLSRKLSKDLLKSEFLPLVKNLAEDDLDNMRILTIDCCVSASGELEVDENIQIVYPILQIIQEDASWRVRQQLAKSFEKLCPRFGEDFCSEKMLSIFVKYLVDNEPQVRLAAVSSLYDVAVFCRLGLVDYLTTPFLEALATDVNDKVRALFAKQLPSLCTPYGKEAAQRVLVPVIQQLSKDELAEVRNNLITQMSELAKALGPDAALDVVLPTLTQLAKDMKWRVRMEVVGQISPLAKLLGKDVFERKLSVLLIEGLADHVHAIREVACEQTCELLRQFGVDWAFDNLIPQTLGKFEKSTNYLHRMTSLFIVTHAAQSISKELFEKYFIPVLIGTCKDEVPNVRFAAAKTITKVGRYITKDVFEAHLKPLLYQMMQKDPDQDVRYFAEEAFKTLSRN